jgi:Flp pilus assembly pilin Flp
MNLPTPPGAETVSYLRALFGSHVARLRLAITEKDRGASAIELAIITAVLAAIAVALLLVIKTFVTNEGNNITNTQNP